jgi:hypothetical protein
MGKTARAKGSALPPWLRGLSLATLGLYLLLSVFVLWRSAVLTPYSDELDWVLRWRAAQASGDWARYLLAPINFHRIAWTFGLIALDIRAFAGTNAPLLVSGALSVGGMAWALGRQAANAASPPLALPAAAVAVMLTLMAGNLFDASQPICVDYTHGAVFAVLAVILAESRAREGPRWFGPAALACAMASALGDAAGLPVWPVLAWGALRRRDWRWLAVVLVVGGLFVGAYASGQGAQTAQSASAALHDPLGALRIAFNVLALPWGLLARAHAWIAGLVLALIAAAALATRGGVYASRSERIACGLILFSIGTAMMAGLGRTELESPLETPLRYAIFVTPLHVGLLMLALPYAGAMWENNRRAALTLWATLLVLLMAQDVAMGAKVIRASDLIRTTVAAFRAGRRTPEATSFVHPDLAHAEEVYAWLKRDGLFRHELHLKPAAPSR